MTAMDGAVIEIRSQPVNAGAQTNQTATFSVVAHSYVAGVPTGPSPAIEYQWYSIIGGATNAIGGAISANYTTPPAVAADNGKIFYCELASPGYKTNTSFATLTVQSPSPVIVTISLSGGNVVIRGTNGPAGETYYVLAGTNVARPLRLWTPILTNTFDGSGNFNFTAAASPAVRQQFYALKRATGN